jgi:hypothetical protein
VRAGDELLEVNGFAVARPEDCYGTFKQPIDGRLRVKLRRAGVEQSIDVPVPQRTQIAFAWRP